jgi:matrixin
MAFDATLAFPEPPTELVRDLAFALSQRYFEGESIAGGTKSRPPPMVSDLASAIRVLIRDGEFALNGDSRVDESALDRLEGSIWQFQSHAPGMLEPSGHLDPATIHRLLTRRGCGVTERRPTDRGPQSDTLGPRLIRVKVEDLPRLGAFRRYSHSLDVLLASIETWTRHLDLEVRTTFDSADANVVVSCDELFGLPKNHVALTDLGPPNGRQLRVIFDASKPWTDESFQSCAIHEFGHILGIRHSDARFRVRSCLTHSNNSIGRRDLWTSKLLKESGE